MRSEREDPGRSDDPIPMELSNDRRFTGAETGPVYVSDIDGTYLQTDLSSLAGMLAIPFEFAIDKVAVPGAVPLLVGLRHGTGVRSAQNPLYFVSASPPQLRRVIERKMIFDGIEYDGIAFKDQLKLALGGRFKQISHHVGYKLAALIRYRMALPKATRWTLFGDDLESDAEIFALFSDVCAGLRGRPLLSALASIGTRGPVAQFVAGLAADLPIEDPVEAVHIRQARLGGARSWMGLAQPLPSMGGRLFAAPDFIQHSLWLHARGHLRAEDVRAVIREVLRRDGRISPEEVAEEAARRAPIDASLVKLL